MDLLEVFKGFDKLLQVCLRNLSAFELGSDHFSQAVFLVISFVNFNQMLFDRAILDFGLCLREKRCEVFFKVVRQPGKRGLDFFHLFHLERYCDNFMILVTNTKIYIVKNKY
jgi:hypothetical protein